MSIPPGISNVGATCYFDSLIHSLYSLDLLMSEDSKLKRFIESLFTNATYEIIVKNFINKKYQHSGTGGNIKNLYDAFFTTFYDMTVKKINEVQYDIDDNLIKIIKKDGNDFNSRATLHKRIKDVMYPTSFKLVRVNGELKQIEESVSVSERNYIEDIINISVVDPIFLNDGDRNKLLYERDNDGNMIPRKCYSIDEYSPFRELICLSISSYYDNRNKVSKLNTTCIDADQTDLNYLSRNKLQIIKSPGEAYDDVNNNKEYDNNLVGYTGKLVCIYVWPEKYLKPNYGDIRPHEIPLILDIYNYIPNITKKYQLKAICYLMRRGNTAGGHYIAVCKRGDKYYEFDDIHTDEKNNVIVEEVKPPFSTHYTSATEKQFIPELYFYELIDTNTGGNLKYINNIQ